MKKIANLKTVYVLVILLAQLFCGVVFAQSSFVVQRIEIEGLQHIDRATVDNYLPIKPGQTLRPGKTADIVRTLYRTNFFEHITLSRDNGTLIIHVVERPIIGQLKIKGNSVIPTDKLTTVMKSLDVAEGRVYNAAILEKIKLSLLNQYYMLGRYNARVLIHTSELPRNRVAVNIDISEGLVAKIRRITIIGNSVFPEDTLIKQLDMTTAGLFTFLTQSDRYSEERLETSVDKLRNYYMDHGYLRFETKSAQAEISPDRKSVYVTIVVTEGLPYTVDRYELRGYYVVPRAELEKVVTIKPGKLFSRQDIMDSQKAMTTYLGDRGYLFTNVQLHPQVNDQDRKVILVFDIDAGKRAYVRHVTFSDNAHTNDVVLRREVRQMEAAPASTSKMEESKHRLNLLPYLKEVEMTVEPVPGVKDQVDVNYKVKEDSSAQASFKVGYSQLYKTIIGAGLNQKNFMGTGNTLGINLQRSSYEQFYGMDYTNPYYTPEGISRSFSLSFSRTEPQNVGMDTGYTANEYDVGVLYGIPILQEQNAINMLQAGLMYQDTIIYLRPGYVSNQLGTFTTRHGTHYQELDFKGGITRDSRDRAIFPTNGTLQSLFVDAFAPATSDSVAFYMTNYSGKWWLPLNDKFIFLTKANLAYGNGFSGIEDFPFFRNYFAGGIDTVRGFVSYSLGPRDSRGKPYGGNVLVTGSLALIFPNYIWDNMRTSLFVDGGNVYSTLNNNNFGGLSTNAGPPLYSVGLEVDLLTPFGPLELSLARGIRPSNSHAELQAFNFAVGANF